MRRLITILWQNESGQDMVEYALLAALVATGSAVLMPAQVHTSIVHIFSAVTSCLDRFANGGG
jgi:Flp pilus assembly pilin Flp